jgi:hypothetical protein
MFVGVCVCLCVCVCVCVFDGLANGWTDLRQTWQGGPLPPRGRY